MEVPVSPDVLINYGRMVTAAFGLVAIWLDPTRPSREVGNVQIVLASYLGFSMLMLGIMGSWSEKLRPIRWITHVIDIGALSLLVLFSEELDSPFFVFFTFTLMTAALQWGMGGILATALALQILLVTSALFDLQDGDSELNILIMRSAYCWVSAVMLGYFATYRERMRHRLARLAAWQPEGVTEQDDAFSQSLDGALQILRARYVIVLWKAIGAANGLAVVRTKGIRQVASHIDGCAIDALKDLRNAQLVKPRDAAARPVWQALEQLPAFDPGTPIRWRSLCVARLVSQRHEGVVIIIDGAGEKEQLAALANIVTLRIAAHLGQLASADEQVEAAGLREREVLARDLHDGVLQHLTAAALHLKVARSDLTTQAERLATVAKILLDQQQQIRRFVEGADATAGHPAQPLEKQLQRLAATLRQHWECEFSVNVTPKTLKLESWLAAQISLLLSEAAANAVRHGRARHVCWTIGREQKSVVLTIEDDGQGLDEAATDQPVPRSLSARVAMLGGRLEMASGAIGVLLRIRLGLRERMT